MLDSLRQFAAELIAPKAIAEDHIEPQAYAVNDYFVVDRTVPFNGEKTPGEIGKIKTYEIEYNDIRARSWQFYLENPVAHLVIDRFVMWMMGSGLKLQSEPIESILQDSGIKIDKEKFRTSVETRFRLF